MNLAGPVFVVGCPRSGTSALSWALASHPDFWTSVETHFFYYLLRDNWLDNAWSDSRGTGSWLEAHAVSIDEFMCHAGNGFDRMMRSRSGGARWVDGSPENLMVGRPLLRMFPDARMLHVVRDPRAVCLSMLTSGFAEPWAHDVGEAIRTWKHYVSAGLDLTAAFPGRVTRIRQEDMRTRPAAVAREIGQSLGVEDVAPIAAFLAHETINSSADKSSYVEFSPFRNAAAETPDPAAFDAFHGARIQEETAPLAVQCGYQWP